MTHTAIGDENGDGTEPSYRTPSARVRSMTASPLLSVGAITVVGAHEFVE